MISELKKRKKKTIKVAAAIIRKDGKVFCAERAYGFLKGKWEFPGGKVEKGENPENAVSREIKEELGIDISVDCFLTNVIFEYPDFILDMDCFQCHILKGNLSLENDVHLAEKWIKENEMNTIDWCQADKKIAEILYGDSKNQ